jgi:hypothetical protein
MAQDLTVNIKTTSDVPQAMDKAKTAVTGFDKQLKDIGTKFGNSFKDIFLGFTAPMVILQSLIGAISSAIEKAKQDAKDGLDLIAKGETVFASSDEAKMARFLKMKAATEEEEKKVKEGRELMTEKFFTETQRGREVMQKIEEDTAASTSGESVAPSPKQLAMQKQYQDMALQEFLKSEEGKKYAHIFAAEGNQLKPGTFKGPEGFGSVVGVGANPVMEKMTRQNEILEEIKLILQDQSANNRTGEGVPPPFTDRAVPLTMMKEGLA